MRNQRLQLCDLDPATLDDATRRQELVDDFNVVLEEHENSTASAKKTARFGIGAAIASLLVAIGLAFIIPGPQGPEGKQGKTGDTGPVGPAITNTDLQREVNTAVEAKLAGLPKPLTASEIRELIPPPAYNDGDLRKEIADLKVKLAESAGKNAEIREEVRRGVPIDADTFHGEARVIVEEYNPEVHKPRNDISKMKGHRTYSTEEEQLSFTVSNKAITALVKEGNQVNGKEQLARDVHPVLAPDGSPLTMDSTPTLKNGKNPYRLLAKGKEGFKLTWFAEPTS